MSGAATPQPTRVRFLADENFRETIVAGLRRRQPLIDIQTAAEAGLLGADDPTVLAYAAAHDRVLLTHDVSTMPVHLDAFLAGGGHSPGVLLLAQTLPIRLAIDELILVWEASEPAEWRDQRTYLPF